MAFEVCFWGVRGTIACPSMSHARYGGNTSCVQLRLDDSVIIFDAGTGIRELGNDLQKQKTREAHLLIKTRKKLERRKNKKKKKKKEQKKEKQQVKKN